MLQLFTGGNIKIAFISSIEDSADLCKATAVRSKMIVAHALNTLIAKPNFPLI
jgi:hypothetical protein